MRTASACLAGLAFLITTTAFGPDGAPAAATPVPKANPNVVARDQTMSLVDAFNAWQAAGPGDRGERLAVLLAIARARGETLQGLIDTDPAEVLRVSLPAAMRAAMPGEASGALERDADEEGELEVLHFDFPDPKANRYDYVLQTVKGRLSLNFATEPPTEIQTGTHVRAHGLRIGDALALQSAAAIETTKATALPNTLGAQKTLAILVNFSDAPTQPFSVATAQTVMFTTTSNFDYEASYQQTWLTGAVAGWFTIASTSTTCDYNTIASQAKQAATAAGYALSNYNRYVYVFPANACTWWGLGTVGGSPSQAWVNSKWGFSLPVVGHEMGHNLGLYHSHSLDCGASSYATSGCTSSDYGDVYDIMGSSGHTPHFNAFQKERLGWLNAGVSPPVVIAATTQGTTSYTIAPMEAARSTAPRAVKIPQNSCASPQTWLYVEARQAVGYDGFLSGYPNIVGGVLVHQATEGNGNSSNLLDMTPATSSWSDPALMTGLSYTDPLRGVTITTASVGTGGATIQVTNPMSACTHLAPGLVLTPTSTQWTPAGTTVTYSATIANNDGCGCGPSTFDVAALVPTGWTASGARTGSISPGTSGSGSVLVTSPPTASPAFYTVAVNAANSVAPTAAAVANGTVAIAAALTDAVTTDKTTYTVPAKPRDIGNVYITTTVRSGTSTVSGATVSVAVTSPKGTTTTLSGTTSSTGMVTLSYPLKLKTSPRGSYAVSSKATMSGMSSTATTSFVVQ
jgi:hypothetical protein